MEEGFTKREKLVGLFLLLIVILTKVTLLVVAQGKGWFLSYSTYLIRLEQGHNLQQGSSVKMFNTEVGKVTRMTIKRDNGRPVVEVTIKVLADYADFVREKSVAEVVTPFPFGSQYIEVIPGPSEVQRLKQRDVIATQTGKKPLADSMAELVNEENLQRVQAILNNLAHLSERLNEQEKVWYSVVKNVDRVALALLKSEGTLGDLLMRRDLAQRLNQTVDRLDLVLKEVNAFAVGLKPVTENLETLTQKLNRDMESLGSILADVKAGSPEFPKLMKSATEFSEEGTEAMETIKSNPLVRFGTSREKKEQPLHVEPRHVK
jgi:phospholipid/cholesterol/gamma-HCH transport system substrate-binding protein